MSDQYQQYPYGQEPQPHQQPPQQHEPQQPYTQTWESQTWDTQYQPQAAYDQQPQAGYPQAGYEQAGYPQAEYPQQAHTDLDTAYLPPQSYPLPPEAPAPVQPQQAQAQAQAQPPYEPPAGPASGYSAPTTTGNQRITDAQRARAEGRSPIIAPGMQPAGLTAVLAVLIAAAAAIGRPAIVVPLVALQAVTAAGWFRLNGMWPARQGIALAFAGGIVADAALLAAGAENGPAAIIGTLGVWVLLTVVVQLRSHAGADERMQGLMATVASSALAILAAGFLAAPTEAVTVGAIAVAVAAVARALPLPGIASVVVALAASAGAGIAAGSMTDIGSSGALLGLAAGGCALIGLRVASYDYPSRFVHMTAGVALPLTAAAPAIYLIGRVVGG
ncbi:hypothetical protein [Streptomyces sp. NPDC050738]|uniref:hypothetical protein n=1 Tax=Streptomyces sp. NPDC050738 TaxID=3154744 RepID=UPI003429BD67